MWFIEMCKKSKFKFTIYISFMILFAVISGVYGFTANKFQYYEIIFLIASGLAGGLLIGVIYHSTIRYLFDKD